MNPSRHYVQLEGSRQSSLNSVMNDRAVQSLESMRIRLERIATIVLADGLVETTLSPLEEEEEDDPPGYLDIPESSGTVSTHTRSGRGKRGSQNPIHNQKRKKRKTTN